MYYNAYRYEDPKIALSCGMMLRECVRFEVLAKSVLESEDFFNFFEYVEVSTFDIASDAFATFKVRFVCIQWFLEKTANLKMS